MRFMQLNTVTMLALYLLLSSTEGAWLPEGVGSVASQLKEAATQSFLRNRGGQEETPTKKLTKMVDQVQDEHEAEDEEELKESSSVAVAEHNDAQEATNSTDLWAYEKENDDGTVLTGSNPFENHTLQSLEESDEPDFYEQEEDEIPEEWTDPSNSTDEWAYEKAHDDGTVLYGTNPLEASGFVWEQDDLSDEAQSEKATSDEKQDGESESESEQDEDAAHPKNQVVLHAGTDLMEPDKQNDEWVTGEETDDGTVLYGTNPLEHQSDDEDEEADDMNNMESKADDDESDDVDHNAVAVTTNSTVNSTHDEEDEDYDDGTLDYGTNPMDMPDDDDEESEEQAAVVGVNSTQSDNEPEEYDDGTVMYGTNPLEPSDEEESSEPEVNPSSKAKALLPPTPSQNVSKETITP